MKFSEITGTDAVVALRKESVDRNQRALYMRRFRPGSLSARRAWIEITHSWSRCWTTRVALRKESVDRNAQGVGEAITNAKVALRKESVDRNDHALAQRQLRQVALRKESVDRNSTKDTPLRTWTGRSPQGERG